MVIYVFIKNIFIVNTSDFDFIWLMLSDYNVDIVFAYESKKEVSVLVYRERIEDGWMFALVNSIRIN